MYKNNKNDHERLSQFLLCLCVCEIISISAPEFKFVSEVILIFSSFDDFLYFYHFSYLVSEKAKILFIQIILLLPIIPFL